MPENKPPLEEMGAEPKEFNHDEHMAKVKSGLGAIIASEDINEIKQIAQSLLSEEEAEQQVEEPKKFTMADYMKGGR